MWLTEQEHQFDKFVHLDHKAAVAVALVLDEAETCFTSNAPLLVIDVPFVPEAGSPKPREDGGRHGAGRGDERYKYC